MEPLFHLIIPVLMLLAIYPRLNKKYILYLAPLTFIMDFDYIIHSVHRLISHSLLFVLVISLLVYILWDKKAFFISLFYLLSHLIFDMGYPGAALFYPFVQKTLYVRAVILLRPEFNIIFKIGSISLNEFKEIVSGAQSSILTMTGFMLIISIFILFLFNKPFSRNP